MFLFERTDSSKTGGYGSLRNSPRDDFDHVRFFRKNDFFSKTFFSLDCARRILRKNVLTCPKNSAQHRVLLVSIWLHGRKLTHFPPIRNMNSMHGQKSSNSHNSSEKCGLQLRFFLEVTNGSRASFELVFALLAPRFQF